MICIYVSSCDLEDTSLVTVPDVYSLVGGEASVGFAGSSWDIFGEPPVWKFDVAAWGSLVSLDVFPQWAPGSYVFEPKIKIETK